MTEIITAYFSVFVAYSSWKDQPANKIISTFAHHMVFFLQESFFLIPLYFMICVKMYYHEFAECDPIPVINYISFYQQLTFRSTLVTFRNKVPYSESLKQITKITISII